MSCPACLFCHSNKQMITHGSTYYCTNCQIYFNEDHDGLRYQYIPSKHGSLRGLHEILCDHCKTINKRIVCTNFDTFFSKVGYCGRCKYAARMAVRNDYYKVVSTCHTHTRMYGWYHRIILFIIMYMCYQYDILHVLLLVIDHLYIWSFSLYAFVGKLAVFYMLSEHTSIRFMVIVLVSMYYLSCQYRYVFVVRIVDGCIDYDITNQFSNLSIR